MYLDLMLLGVQMGGIILIVGYFAQEALAFLRGI